MEWLTGFYKTAVLYKKVSLSWLMITFWPGQMQLPSSKVDQVRHCLFRLGLGWQVQADGKAVLAATQRHYSNALKRRALLGWHSIADHRASTRTRVSSYGLGVMPPKCRSIPLGGSWSSRHCHSSEDVLQLENSRHFSVEALAIVDQHAVVLSLAAVKQMGICLDDCRLTGLSLGHLTSGHVSGALLQHLTSMNACRHLSSWRQ